MIESFDVQEARVRVFALELKLAECDGWENHLLAEISEWADMHPKFKIQSITFDGDTSMPLGAVTPEQRLMATLGFGQPGVEPSKFLGVAQVNYMDVSDESEKELKETG